ncbi:tyrosine-type recombinase/integrase, partial [Streptomyces sp. NPDC051940]|uniref:tyrosine-type recombinase/integrase n=1 Tax=Streptomyces sp. NPDC051940 TaxID=3155675 RepID=UPI00342AF636
MPTAALDDPTPYDLAPLATSWVRSLSARNCSPNTIRIYRRAVEGFRDFLLAYSPEHEDGRPAPAELEGERGIHREHVEAHIIGIRDRTSAGNAHQHFRSLKTFFRWLVEEEEMLRSPMRTMKPPETGEVIVPVIPDDALKKLFDTCKGRTFQDRRDKALLMMFLDTGGRLSEVTERTQDKLDLGINVLYVIGKGDKERPLPFGRATALCLDRYLRALPKHLARPVVGDDPLWFSVKGRRALTIW